MSLYKKGDLSFMLAAVFQRGWVFVGHAYYWIILLPSLPFILLYFLLFYLGLRRVAKAYLRVISLIWSRMILGPLGGKRVIYGKQLLPTKQELSQNRVYFVGNHQSTLDILLIMAEFPFNVGFFAKKELAWVPVLNLWMYALDCVFLDRKNPLKALRSLKNSLNSVGNVFRDPMVLFPEGTRSKSPSMGSFQRGFSTLLQGQEIIIPFALDKTYLISQGFYQRGIMLTFLPPIHKDFSTFSLYEKYAFIEGLRTCVQQTLGKQATS